MRAPKRGTRTAVRWGLEGCGARSAPAPLRLRPWGRAVPHRRRAPPAGMGRDFPV